MSALPSDHNEPAWLVAIASPHIFLLCCSWLFVLTVVGTLAQVDLGLYLAQHRYFSSWFIPVFGWLPLPGGALTMGMVFLNLLAFLFTRRGTRRFGLVVLHGGVLLLIGGAYVAGWFRWEGQMVLDYERSVDQVESYHKHELVVMEFRDEDLPVTVFGEGRLQPGTELAHAELPFSATVLEHHLNVRPVDGDSLEALPVETTFERNNPGVVLRIDGESHAMHLQQPDWLRLREDGRDFAIGLRKARRFIPIGIELEEFIHEKHAGTEMAKTYSSRVIVHAEDHSRPVLITMNEPLRIDGWTFYQHSFFPMPNGREGSVLAVVHDKVAWYPYVATIIMSIGLFIHLVQQLPRLLQERDEEDAA
ncbi:MAG: cytochrome c biogenesis protein ResB [Planctomycetota bacterium]